MLIKCNSVESVSTRWYFGERNLRVTLEDVDLVALASEIENTIVPEEFLKGFSDKFMIDYLESKGYTVTK